MNQVIRQQQILISVIIPAKNEELCMKKSLPAVKNAIKQWGGKAEIILVDNGSTDKTILLAKKYGCKVLKNTYGNISHLRNVGADNAKGLILAFLDADCIVSPLWIAICIKHFQKNEIGVVGTPAVPDINPTWVEQAWSSLMPSAKRPEFVKWLGTSNVLIDKQCFDEVDGFDEALIVAEDVDLCRRIRKRGKKIYLEQRITTVHLRESKTLKELFKRECWRGQNSIKVFQKNNFSCSDLPSIVVPAVNALAITSLLPVVILYGIKYLSIPLSIILIIPLLLLLKKRIKIKTTSPFLYLQCYVISFTYILARSCSILMEVGLLIKGALQGRAV